MFYDEYRGVIAHPVDPLGTSPAATLVTPNKRILPLFSKPTRSARLGAAAAAALAACGNGDLDAEAESCPEPLLGECLLTPDMAAPTSDANKLITSLLTSGVMPALPGSPTLETSDAQTPHRLFKQSSVQAILQGRASTGSSMQPKGTAQVRFGMYSPVRYIGKWQSERSVTVANVNVNVNGSVSSGCDGGAGATHYDAAAAVATVHTLRALSRKSVDAAADAIMLTTRQVSELSPTAMSGGKKAGSRAAVVAAAGSLEKSGESGGDAFGGPKSVSGVNKLYEGGIASARARICLRSASGVADTLLTGRSVVMPTQNRVGVAPGHVGCTTGAVQNRIPQASSFPILPSKQHSRLLVRSGTDPVPQDLGAVGGEEAPGGLRRRDSETRGRPKWLERLLRAFHVERVYRVGKGSAGGGVGDNQHGCGTAGGLDGGVAAGAADDSGVGKGAPGAVRGDEKTQGDHRGGDARAGKVNEQTGGNGSGGGGGGRDSHCAASGGGGGGGSDAGLSRRGAVNAARSTRDQLLAATRLLSSRRRSRSRSSRTGSEQSPPVVTPSRDSASVHRARLAQQARLPHVLVAAPVEIPTCLQVVGVTREDKHGFVAGFADKAGSGGVAGGASGAGASAEARIVGISVTAYAHAASAATTSLAKVTAAAAVASSFAGPIDVREVCFNTHCGSGANLRNNLRGNASNPSARRLRQVSAPGGSEPHFASLSQLETRSVDGAECLTNSVAVNCDSDLVNDDENTCLTNRTGAMTFRR